jgi:DNA-binding GntR family transcriptional regulator
MAGAKRTSNARLADGAGQRSSATAAFLAPASTVLLSDEVVDRIREAILSGGFAPGHRLREEELAEALNVSRGPVRSALLQLDREGMVMRRRNRGAIVARLSLADLQEVYSLRTAIEPVACEWAARNADDDDFAEMDLIISGYSRLNSKSTVQDAAAADLSFHDVLYRAARHRRLLRLWDDLRPQVYTFLLARTYVRNKEFRQVMIDNHTAIRDAVASRDEQTAREAAARHVRTSYARVLEAYESEAADHEEEPDGE